MQKSNFLFIYETFLVCHVIRKKGKDFHSINNDFKDNSIMAVLQIVFVPLFDLLPSKDIMCHGLRLHKLIRFH